MGRLSLTPILFFFLLLANATNLLAIGGPQLGAPNVPGQYPRAQNHPAAEGNPACQRILNECRRLGFIYGQWKKDNGLYRDCFDPVLNGGTPTRDGRPIEVPVSQGDVQACRRAHHK